jgi:putative SOS response-associated peptidase YedK
LGFVTANANNVAGAFRAKAMQVVLTGREEIEIWMTAPAEGALQLQRPLPDGALTIVARGEWKDEALTFA